MPKVSYNLDSYAYFEHFCPHIAKGTVLDFGSNYSTFLDSSKGKFPQQQYTGVDVDEQALAVGRQQFPQATFVHYDGYNQMYNPQGKEHFPVLDYTYDTIVSYSVFSHTSEEDLVFMISRLHQHLNPGGTMLLSWLDSYDKMTTLFFYKKRVQQFGSCDVIPKADRVYIVDNKVSATAEEGESLLTFYSKQYLSNLLSEYDFELLSAPDPRATGCFQSCIKITKP